MFEKQSHVNTSVSWGGCAAVWAQTPRQAKERDSSFALCCRLAEQAGPHQNRRPLQIFIISPLLTSLLIFPWNKRSHKVLIPLSFSHSSPWEETKFAHTWYYQTQGAGFGHSCSGVWNICPTQKLCPSPTPSLAGMFMPFWQQAIVFFRFSHTGQNMEHPLYLEHSEELWNTPPRPFSLPISPSTLHPLPWAPRELPWSSSSQTCS